MRWPVSWKGEQKLRLHCESWLSVTHLTYLSFSTSHFFFCKLRSDTHFSKTAFCSKIMLKFCFKTYHPILIGSCQEVTVLFFLRRRPKFSSQYGNSFMSLSPHSLWYYTLLYFIAWLIHSILIRPLYKYCTIIGAKILRIALVRKTLLLTIPWSEGRKRGEDYGDQRKDMR